MLRDKKIRAGRIFDTLADMGSLFMTVIYFVYVALLLFFKMGVLWLNICMLVITILYAAFFITKIAALNRIFAKNNAERSARFALRYSKWAMKMINAAFVILSVASAQQYGGGDVLMLIGVLIVLISFTVSVLWDVAFFYFKRRFRDLWKDWGKLTRDEKHERIENFMGQIINEIDTLAGVDLVESIKVPRKKFEIIDTTKDDTDDAEPF
jgi:hypothetical protein